MEEAQWYVVHTYSGYENKVRDDIKKTVISRNMQDQIVDVMVPTRQTVETTASGARKTVETKLYPGYVFVKMIENEATWYLVRNTRGVTGFVGPGSDPTPLSPAEIHSLGIKVDAVHVDFAEGDLVVVVAGSFKDTKGVIRAVNESRQSITINVDMFGQEVPVELNFAEVRKL